MDQNNRITSGNIPKGILLYFVPIFIGSMFQQLYNTADTIIVGRFEKEFGLYICLIFIRSKEE